MTDDELDLLADQRLLSEREEEPLFTIYVFNHTSEYIDLQMNFTDPEAISRGFIKDELHCKILEPNIFISINNKSLNIDSY